MSENEQVVINVPSDENNRVWSTPSINGPGTIEIIAIRTYDGQESETIPLVNVVCSPSDGEYVEVQIRIKAVELPLPTEE